MAGKIINVNLEVYIAKTSFIPYKDQYHVQKPIQLVTGLAVPAAKPVINEACHQQPLSLDMLENQVARDFDNLAHALKLLQQQHDK